MQEFLELTGLQALGDPQDKKVLLELRDQMDKRDRKVRSETAERLVLQDRRERVEYKEGLDGKEKLVALEPLVHQGIPVSCFCRQKAIDTTNLN